MDLDTWACPVCRSRLSETGAGLRCSAEGIAFETREGVDLLLRPEDLGLLDDAAGYATAWKADGWAMRHEEVRQLPYLRSGPQRGKWRAKARSLEALLAILGPPRGRKLADAGAGTGWLSHRLVEAGFRCYAFDISPDPQVGIGSASAFDATRHTFERVVATLTRWPLLDGSVDVAVCNASLHYLADIRPAVSEAARILRADGVFVVMNDPVNRDPASARRASGDFQRHLRDLGGRGKLLDGHRHLVASDLEADLGRTFSRVTRHDPDYGAAFRLARAVKSAFLRMELASFPIYVARRG